MKVFVDEEGKLNMKEKYVEITSIDNKIIQNVDIDGNKIELYIDLRVNRHLQNKLNGDEDIILYTPSLKLVRPKFRKNIKIISQTKEKNLIDETKEFFKTGEVKNIIPLMVAVSDNIYINFKKEPEKYHRILSEIESHLFKTNQEYVNEMLKVFVGKNRFVRFPKYYKRR